MGTVGGCVFAHNPSLPAGEGQIFWLPELSPSTLILESAPAGFQLASAGDPNTLGIVLADRQDADGRELVIGDISGELHIRLRAAEAALRPAVLLPADAAFALRLDVARRFIGRLRGRPMQLLPPALRLRPPQKHHLIQFLHTADVIDAGGGAREVAGLVLKSEQAFLPSAEWKDSAIRRHAIRLIRGSAALIESGYLKILQGH